MSEATLVSAMEAGPQPAQTGEFVARHRIGRYEVLQQIGVGGMGVVFAAYDGVLDRQVAIKLVRADRTDAASQARIVREGRALARLADPNVVAVHEVSTFAGQVFLVMEYVKGTTLRRWSAAGRRDMHEVLAVFQQVGRGLAAAHRQGLVHRDFKPDNVLIGEDGRARVVDFGLVADPSRRDEDEAAAGEAGVVALADAQLTFTGAFPGTPAYMAPEQLAGLGADARSDQYSFCVALYEALCGERPVVGASWRGRGVPEWLLATIRRGLAPDPDARWPGMDALLAVLAKDPVAARRRRWRQAVLLVAVAIAAALVLLGLGELRRGWQVEQLEGEAAAQLAAVEARIAAARARDDGGAAARSFEDFVGDPRFSATRALASAWLGEAGRRRGDGAVDAASAAYARAFFHARTPVQGLAALDGLAEVFRAQERWEALSEVLAAIGRVDASASAAPERRSQAFAAALGRRDVAAAQALLGAEEPASVHRLLGFLGGPARASDFDNMPDLHHLQVGFDHDGDDETQLLLLRRDAAGARLDVVRRDPWLTRLATYTTADVPPPRIDMLLPLMRGDDGRLLLLGTPGPWQDADSRVLRAGPGGGLEELFRWPENSLMSTRAGDLDGDGVDELYVGTGPYTRRLTELVRAPDGSFSTRAPIAAGDEPASDINEMQIVDLDGDGRRELVMATGPWQSYDVRIYQREADGLLHMVARDMLGVVASARPVRVGGELLLATSHPHNFASRVMFPPERSMGEAPGVYLLRFTGAALERVAHLELPGEAARGAHVLRLIDAADLDGDGREDLAVAVYREATRSTVFYLQEPTGSFTAVSLGDANVLAAAELDGDAAPELLLVLGRDRHSGHLWIVGAGDARLPVSVQGGVSSPTAGPGGTEWTRAGELRAMGLHASAGEAFAELARDAQSAESSAAARLAAAEAFERSDDHRRAAELFESGHEEGPSREAANRGAYRTRLRLGEHAAALAALERLLVSPDLVDRSELLAARERLAAVAGGERVELRFAEPLGSAWTITDPLALRRDSAAGTLDVDTASAGVLASLPVVLHSDHVELWLDVTLELLEWSATLQVELVAEGSEEPSIVLQAGAGGGGRTLVRGYACVFGHHRIAPVSSTQGGPSDELARVVLRGASIRPLREHDCTFALVGAATRQETARDNTAPQQLRGPHRLVLRTTTQDGPARLRAKIHRVGLLGGSVSETTGMIDPAAVLAGELVEGRFVAARELVPGLVAPSSTQRLWAADLALRAGDLAAAEPALAELLRASAADPALRGGLGGLLRRDVGLYAPALGAASPIEFMDLLVGTYVTTVRQHIEEPRVQRELLELLGRIDLTGRAAEVSDPAGRERVATLLMWRGLAQQRMHRGEAARADLERALALYASASDDPLGERRRDLAIELAVLAMLAGDPGLARRWADEAIAVSVNRSTARDRLRARAPLAELTL